MSSSDDHVFSEFRSATRKKLNAFRMDKKYCDVTIRVQEEAFECHRAVLASASEYFDSMFGGNFKEKSTGDVVLHDIDAPSFKILLEFMYTGCIADVNEGNIRDLLLASSILDISAMQSYGADFYAREQYFDYDFEDIIELFIFACSINNEALISDLKSYLVTHFNEMCPREEFLEIPFYGLNSLLEGYKKCENNEFKKIEDLVLDTIIRWVHHKPDERKIHFEKLSAWIQFEKVSAEYVQFLSKEYGIASNTPRIGEDKLLKLKKNLIDYFEYDR